MSVDAYREAVADRMSGNTCPVAGCGARIGCGFWWCDPCASVGQGTAAWSDLMQGLDAQIKDIDRDLTLERGAAKARVTAEIDAARRAPS